MTKMTAGHMTKMTTGHIFAPSLVFQMSLNPGNYNYPTRLEL